MVPPTVAKFGLNGSSTIPARTLWLWAVTPVVALKISRTPKRVRVSSTVTERTWVVGSQATKVKSIPLPCVVVGMTASDKEVLVAKYRAPATFEERVGGI